MSRSILVSIALAALSAQAAELVVVEKVAGAVGFYTPEGKRFAGVKIGKHPHEIVVSPDKRYGYVSENGILWMQYAGEGGNAIAIIDMAKRTLAGHIDLGTYRRPHGLAIDPKSGHLFSTIENPDGLVRIDLTTRKVVRKYDIKGKSPHMVILGPGSQYAYVSNTVSNTVAAIKLDTGDVKLIPVDGRPQGGVLSHDGKLLYMTCSEGNSIAIIDTATNQRVGTIATGKGPGRIYLTPDGKTLVYNLQPGEGAAFADVATRKETKRIALGGKVLSLTASPDGKIAYAGLQEIDKIAVISIPEQRVIKTIDTPKDSGPDPVLPFGF